MRLAVKSHKVHNLIPHANLLYLLLLSMGSLGVEGIVNVVLAPYLSTWGGLICMWQDNRVV